MYMQVCVVTTANPKTEVIRAGNAMCEGQRSDWSQANLPVLRTHDLTTFPGPLAFCSFMAGRKGQESTLAGILVATAKCVL